MYIYYYIEFTMMIIKIININFLFDFVKFNGGKLF